MEIIRGKEQPLHSPVKAIKKLRAGQTVYSVHALGKNSYLTKYTVAGRATTMKSVTVFDSNTSITNVYDSILLQDYFGNRAFFEKRSLMDMNVVPNNYNNHRLFHSRRKAESYLNLCLQGVIAYNPPLDNLYDSWDYYDEDNEGSFDFEDDEPAPNLHNDRDAKDDSENIGV